MSKITKKFGPYIVVSVFTLISSLLLVDGVSRYKKQSEFIGVAIEVSGIVIEKTRVGGKSLAPTLTVRYIDLAGKEQLFKTTPFYPSSFFLGQQVTILYDQKKQNEPFGAQIKSFGQQWGNVILELLSGLIFIVLLSKWLVQAIRSTC